MSRKQLIRFIQNYKKRQQRLSMYPMLSQYLIKNFTQAQNKRRKNWLKPKPPLLTLI